MSLTNRRAHHEYTILGTYEAGITLLGTEVKTVKGGRMGLEGSFVKLVGNELYLVNAEIPLYQFARPEGYNPKRSRKLLLHKKEIQTLQGKIAQSNLTLVPLSCYTKHGFIKLQIGLARGKKQYEKREQKKREDIDRETEREVRGKD